MCIMHERQFDNLDVVSPGELSRRRERHDTCTARNISICTESHMCVRGSAYTRAINARYTRQRTRPTEMREPSENVYAERRFLRSTASMHLRHYALQLCTGTSSLFRAFIHAPSRISRLLSPFTARCHPRLPHPRCKHATIYRMTLRRE